MPLKEKVNNKVSTIDLTFRYVNLDGINLVPGMGAVFDSFLSVLSPSIAIVKVINFTLCHERKSRFSLSLLILLFRFQPEKNNNTHMTPLNLLQKPVKTQTTATTTNTNKPHHKIHCLNRF